MSIKSVSILTISLFAILIIPIICLWADSDEFLVNTYTTSDQRCIGSDSVDINDAGNFVVAWHSMNQDGDLWGVFAQRYDSNGNTVGSEFQVNTYTYWHQMCPAVAIANNGNFVISWNSGADGSGWGIFAQRYDSNGNPIGSEFQVNTFTPNHQEYSAIGMDDAGNFVITWHSWAQDNSSNYDYGIYAQRFDSNGNSVGSEFQVNMTTYGDQWIPSVTMNSTGKFLITWNNGSQKTSENDVYARLYNPNGTPVTSEFKVNTYTPGFQADPSEAMDDDGNFVVTWKSSEQDGSSWGIYAQRYDFNATPIGSEFLVNTNSEDDQSRPRMAMDGIGNFIITWHSANQDGSGWGIYAQSFDSNGNPLFQESKVNTYTQKDQAEPSIAMNSNGEYVISWESLEQFSQSSGYDIYATSEIPPPPPTSPWPIFKQNNARTGKSPYAGPENSYLKWKFDTGDWVRSSPAIGLDGTIYVGSHNMFLYAINSDGSPKWSYETGGEVHPGIGPDGTIYVGSWDSNGNFYAIEPDGSLKWTYPTGGNISSSPLFLNDGTILIGRDNLFALNPDGTLNWSSPPIGINESSPALGPDGTLYVGSYNDNHLYAINDDGTLKWSFLTGGSIPSSPSIAVDGTIYVGSWDHYLYAVNSDGTEKWKFGTGDVVRSSPSIGSDGTIYFGSYDGYLYAVNPNGTQKWKSQWSNLVYNSPAIDSNDIIYYGSLDDYIYALNPDDGSIIWSYLTAGGIDYSCPAISSDGTLYIGSCDGNLYAIGYNTPPGTDVVYEDTDSGTTLTFDEVTEGGNTSVTVTDKGPPPPTGFKLAPINTYYEIVTTAEFTENIEICINYDDSGMSQKKEEKLKLKVYEDGDWVDITTSIDTTNNIICGVTDHLSFFGVMYQEDENAISLKSFTAKAKDDSVIIEWQTGTEIDNLGFYIIRSENIYSGYTILNEKIITAQGNPYSGQAYSYVDNTVESGRVYYYWLVDVDIYGKFTIHGSVKVVTNIGY